MSKVKTNKIGDAKHTHNVGDYIRVLVSDPAIGNTKGKAAKILDVFTSGVVVKFQLPETCPVAFFEHSEVQRIPRLLN